MGFSPPVLSIITAATTAANAVKTIATTTDSIASQRADYKGYDRERAALSIERQKRDLRRLVGRERARYSTGGVTLSGSPGLILDDLIEQGELDQQITKQTGEERALRADYLDQLYRSRSRAGLVSSGLRAGTSLLSASEKFSGL